MHTYTNTNKKPARYGDTILYSQSQKAETGGFFPVLGQPGLQSKFEDTLCFIVRSCLKIKPNESTDGRGCMYMWVAEWMNRWVDICMYVYIHIWVDG